MGKLGTSTFEETLSAWQYDCHSPHRAAVCNFLCHENKENEVLWRQAWKNWN